MACFTPETYALVLARSVLSAATAFCHVAREVVTALAVSMRACSVATTSVVACETPATRMGGSAALCLLIPLISC